MSRPLTLNDNKSNTFFTVLKKGEGGRKGRTGKRKEKEEAPGHS